MGKSQKIKGANGERELIKILNEELGIDFSRNLNQTRDGGQDVNGSLKLAIEVKRNESGQIRTWWRQAVKQANKESIPVLAYRQNYQRDWWFVLPLSELMSADPFVRAGDLDIEHTATLRTQGFCYWVRENLEWLQK